MKQFRVPLINDKFDMSIFAQVLSKTWWLCVVFMVVSVVSAFLYMRYTQPLYQSSCIIQINEEDRSADMLNFTSKQYNKTDLSKTLELMRSKEFLKKALNTLPLEISYYNEGTFLSFELYPDAPFEIVLGSHNGDLYNKPFYVDFIDSTSAKITPKGYENAESQIIKLGDWEQVSNAMIKCVVKNQKSIEEHSTHANERYFVVINDPRTIIEQHSKNIDISLLSSAAQTIKITYTGYNPNKTWHMVNTIAEEYLKYDVKTKRESAANILTFIDEQLKSIYNSLDETEKQIQSFKKENKIKVSTEPASAVLTQKIETLEDKISNIDYELLAIEQVKNKMLAETDINTYEIQASLAGTTVSQMMSNILSNLQKIIDERQILLNSFTPDNIKIKQIEKQLETQVDLVVDFVNTIIERMREQRADFQKQIADYEKWMSSSKNYDELEYARLQRMYEVNQTYYNQLIDKKAEYLISQAGYISRNTILENASTPVAPISPKSANIYFVFITLGVIVCCLCVILRYLLYSEVTSVASIQNYTKAPILGVVPQYDGDVDVSQLLIHKDPHSVFSESFRSIRSNLQFISHGAETKIITVSSTISGEGKTMVAINLAGIIATAGKKVILLDLDLRKPRLHLGFNVSNARGMSTILIGCDSIADCVRHTEIKGLDFITAGPIPPNPSELADCENMEKVLDNLSEEYDVIIIDTPPIGVVSDAISNMHRANYPIYVMKVGVSKRQFIENINNLRADKGMDNLSVILNGTSLNSRSQYIGYGYGYGSYGYVYGNKEKNKGGVKRVFSRFQK